MTAEAGEGVASAVPERWVFGETPLAQSLELAPLMRRVVGLATSLEAPSPAVDRLIDALRQAEEELLEVAPADPRPRVGDEAPDERRVYLDHGVDVGAYNPCFPEYRIDVEGSHARGTVEFPLAFEGPPGLVHGGVIAAFFDLVIQHHNCLVGQAGRTTNLSLRYRRPTPVGVELRFEVDRSVGDTRITSEARILHGEEVTALVTMEAVAGNRANLPVVSPRRMP